MEGVSVWPSLLEAISVFTLSTVFKSQELYGQLKFSFSYLKLCVWGLCTTSMLGVYGGWSIGSLELGLLVAVSQHGLLVAVNQPGPRTLYQSSQCSFKLSSHLFSPSKQLQK